MLITATRPIWYFNLSSSKSPGSDTVTLPYVSVPGHHSQGNVCETLVTSDPRKEQWLKMEYFSYIESQSHSAFHTWSRSYTILISLGYYRVIHLVFKIRWEGRRGRNIWAKNYRWKINVHSGFWTGLANWNPQRNISVSVWIFDPKVCLFLRLQAEFAKFNLKK